MTWSPAVNRKTVRRRDRPTAMPEPYRNTVMEGFIDDYGRIRLFVALTALALLVAHGFLDTWTWVRAINAISLAVMAVHAGWNLHKGIRRPHVSLALDMTVTGIAAGVAVDPFTAGLSWTFWCVVITFVTYGRV